MSGDPSNSGSGRVPRIDRWYHGPRAFTDTYIGQRGETRIHAVNGCPDDGPSIAPIIVEQGELEKYNEVDESQVPEWAKQRVGDLFIAKDRELDALRKTDTEQSGGGD